MAFVDDNLRELRRVAWIAIFFLAAFFGLAILLFGRNP